MPKRISCPARRSSALSQVAEELPSLPCSGTARRTNAAPTAREVNLKLSNWLSAALGTKYDPLLERQLDRHWLRWTLISGWSCVAWLLWQRWIYVQGLALGDTDDNMRLMQVRGLLAGQGWHDLPNIGSIRRAG